EHLLAQRRTENNQSDSALLLTDQQQSVIAAQGLALAYTPYGHRHPSAGPMNLPGFTGQRVDPVTGHYLLGNGYRAFNPVLMRFNSPDSLSPFGEGGVNAYAYCEGDPVNLTDVSGHMFNPLKLFLETKRFNRRSSPVAGSSSSSGLVSAHSSSSLDVVTTVGSVPSTPSTSAKAVAALEKSGPIKAISKSRKDFDIDYAYSHYSGQEYNFDLAEFHMRIYRSQGITPPVEFLKLYEVFQKEFLRTTRVLNKARPPSYEFATQAPPPYSKLRDIRHAQ
uniref:RHS repeat-associated core domain-containing protein n=1 Tax=Pseudomonas syringae TaxID=317 RepID=UPI001F31BCF2